MLRTLVPFLAAFAVLAGLSVPAPTSAATGDLTFESCLASEPNLTGVEGCVDLTATNEEVRNLTSVATSPDGAHVYAVTSHTVSHFVRTPVTGDLTYADCLTTGGSVVGCTNLNATTNALRGAISLRLSPDGRHLYVTSFLEDGITMLVVGSDGSLSFGGCWSSASKAGCTDLSATTGALDNVEGLAISNDGGFVYTTSPASTSGNVAVFTRDAAGMLQFAGCWSNVDLVGCTNISATTNALEDVGPVALTADGTDLYLGAYNRAALIHFQRNIANGLLTFGGCWTTSAGTTGCNQLGTAQNILQRIDHEGIAISPDGSTVYTASIASHVSQFDRGAGGTLSFKGCIAATGSDCVVPFQTPGFGGLRSITVSPDGRGLYAAANSHALLFLRRDQSGVLTFGQCLVDNPSNANCIDNRPATEDALRNAMGIAISPDGTSVYAVGRNAITHAQRETNLCIPNQFTMCLSDRRFEVTVGWRDPASNEGQGIVIEFGSVDSGLFYFFNPDNFEVLIKVLDACSFNNRFWVFAAATTDVEYTLRVRDVLSGAVKEYMNPLGNAAAAITDTDAFATCDTSSKAPSPTFTSLRLDQLESVPGVLAELDLGSAALQTEDCQESATVTCLSNERFRVEIDWRDFQDNTGNASVFPFGSPDSALYYFFNANNIELLVKVLNACGFNDRIWVFAAATTDVEYTLKVTDTRTGAMKEYRNPLGVASDAITDTGAFTTCP